MVGGGCFPSNKFCWRRILVGRAQMRRVFVVPASGIRSVFTFRFEISKMLAKCIMRAVGSARKTLNMIELLRPDALQSMHHKRMTVELKSLQHKRWNAIARKYLLQRDAHSKSLIGTDGYRRGRLHRRRPHPGRCGLRHQCSSLCCRPAPCGRSPPRRGRRTPSYRRRGQHTPWARLALCL